MPAASPCVPATDECPLSEAIRVLPPVTRTGRRTSMVLGEALRRGRTHENP
jgi:hypothetical protein